MRASHRVCPRCGGAKLPDALAGWLAASAESRKRAGLGPRARRIVEGSTFWFLAGCPAVGGWVGCEMGEVISGFTFAVIGLVLGSAAWNLFAYLVRRYLPEAAEPIGVERPSLPAAGDAGAAIVGRVTALPTQILRSPLRNQECVAARVVGEVGTFAVDDAVMVGFIVETDAGERVHVGASDAAVALDPGPAMTLWADDPARERLLEPFLRERGLLAVAEHARLAEAVVRAGDVVRVEGTVVEVADPGGEGGGFREAPRVRRVEGSLERPVVIRLERAQAEGTA